MRTMDNIVERNVIEIDVPKGVRFVGEWYRRKDGYSLENYPFPHILNKTLTGCGYTRFCIVDDDQNLILLSPRKFLLENKRDQHLDLVNLYYAENKMERMVDYERDISKDAKTSKVKELSESEKKKSAESVIKLKEEVRKHWTNCQYVYKKPCKILVTYDSFRHVLEELGPDIKKFQIVVDEFQSIFVDARFKSEAELELVNNLKVAQEKYGVKRICYVSATPMMDTYLREMDEFKDLPFYEFNWEKLEPGRTKKPKLDVHFVTSPLIKSVNRVIQRYLNENYEYRWAETEVGPFKIPSDEAVLFLNSVKDICQAIRTNALVPSECNILCANNPENEKKVREAFNESIKVYTENKKKELKEKKETLKKWKLDLESKGRSEENIKILTRDLEEECKHLKEESEILPLTRNDKAIGEIPVKGEPHKTFTFCTRTVYLGADFYSTCASTFIFSDSNIDCLSVDISLDLEQILGRQRLDMNPWKDTATIYIKTTKDAKKMNKDDFQKILNDKISNSESALRAYNSAEDSDKGVIARKYRTAVIVEHYRYDYIAVNKHSGSDLKPVFNKLMYLSEVRAFEVQQKDYADRFTVINNLGNITGGEISDWARSFVENFNEMKTTYERLKYLVEFEADQKTSPEDMANIFLLIPDKYRNYFEVLGPVRIKANGYSEAELKKELERSYTWGESGTEIKDKIYETFEVGRRYSKAFIKEKLKKIYNEFNYSITPKASQLADYFIIKYVKFPEKPGDKPVNGFEILDKSLKIEWDKEFVAMPKDDDAIIEY